MAPVTRAWIRSALVASALACVWIATTATVAYGGIYKCTAPDGSTRYTSDASHCPNAQEQVLKKKVQKVIDHDTTRSRRARPAARRRPQGDGLEAMWKAKRPAAQRELADTERRLKQMHDVIKGCNRGGEWYKTDEAGIRRHIPCNELRERRAKLQQKREELTDYLADGLQDECRRSGCQPGWVR
jgi:hypothetical protein